MINGLQLTSAPAGRAVGAVDTLVDAWTPRRGRRQAGVWMGASRDS